MTQMLKRFLVLLAVGLSLSASGQGTIVYNNPADIPVFGGAIYVNYNFDVNGDGTTDFVLRAINAEFMVIPVGQNAVLGTPDPPPNLVGAVGALVPGYTISLNPVSPREWIRSGVAPVAGAYGPVFGYEWQQVTSDAYMGAQFYIGPEIHYGWVHLRAFSNGGYIKEWAYDTVAGQGILAGAVPEPSAWVFLLLGLGAFAFSRCRR